MRSTSDQPRSPRRGGLTRGRVALIVVAVAAFILLTSLRGIAAFYTDYLWFDALGLSGVWANVLGARIALAVIFTLVFFVVLWGNWMVADRLAPRFRPAGPEEEMVERYHEAIAHRTGLVRVGVSLLLALIAGLGTAGRWNDWILFRNRVDFGVEDPLHGIDVGYYVFQLPFLSFLVDWAFTALIVIVVVTAVAHYLNGGIRFQTQGQRVTSQVKLHLSVLLGVLALLRTVDYWLQRHELNFSGRGTVDGATFTDVNIQLPALNLLVWISVAAAVLFLVNVWLRGWVLPVIAVGVWAFASLAVATIYPAIYQRISVEPTESTKEAPYIERNIEFTRMAYGIDDIAEQSFPYTEELDSQDLIDNSETIRNVRLWEPSILERTYQRLQEVRSFYRFNDVDVDRYVIDGQLTQVVLSARELRPDGLPSQSWENQHLAYTHGYGAVLSPANSVTSDGQPDFVVKDVPPQGTPEIERPAVYYGENLGGFAIVGAGRDEIDYQQADGDPVLTRYDGDGGVPMGSLLRELAFSLRFWDVNPVISDFVGGDAKIIYIRDVRDRVQAAAPFLHFDDDPYPAVIDGRIQWIIDAYTTTDRFPYSQGAETDRLEAGSGLNHGFNYVRNSVKAVVDAYHGTMDFYVVDPDDPIAAAYEKAFPELFTPGVDAPDELWAHFRYPEDLFKIQTNMWGDYHIEDGSAFYGKTDAWDIAQDPGTGQITGQAATTQTVNEDGTLGPPRERRMDPYYLMMKLPGDDAEQFLALQPFVPFSTDDTRKELSAFMVAKSDPEQYGELEVFTMPRDQQVDGPSIVDARIQQDPTISELVTLLNQSGSEVLQGNLLVIPVESSLLYIRPLYVQASNTQVPELKRVIVAHGDNVVMRTSLRDALVALFGEAPETFEEGLADVDEALPGSATEDGGGSEGEDDDGTPDGPVTTEVVDLLAEASAAFAEADVALREGDLSTYQEKVDEARALIDRARSSSGPAPTTTTVPGDGQQAAPA